MDELFLIPRVPVKVMDVIKGLYGIDMADNLIDLDYENKPMKLSGFCGKS